jgi:hypothetical protein
MLIHWQHFSTNFLLREPMNGHIKESHFFTYLWLINNALSSSDYGVEKL